MQLNTVNGARIGLYEKCRDIFARHQSEGMIVDVEAAAVMGFLGAVLASPMFQIKVRLQSQTTSQATVGHQHRF